MENYTVEAVSTKNLGLKLVGMNWHNYKGTESEKAREVLGTLKKGDVVTALLNDGGFTDLIPTGEKKEVAPSNYVPQEKLNPTPFQPKPPVKRGVDFLEDYVTFDELLLLLEKATKGDYRFDTNLIQYNPTTKTAVFKAVLTGSFHDDKGTVLREATGHGDCDQDNGGMVKQHYVRMAETRAICRAIRVFLAIGKTANEELTHE